MTRIDAQISHATLRQREEVPGSGGSPAGSAAEAGHGSAQSPPPASSALRRSVLVARLEDRAWLAREPDGGASPLAIVRRRDLDALCVAVDRWERWRRGQCDFPGGLADEEVALLAAAGGVG